MNILITGGAGFVGAHITRMLQTANPEANLVVIDDMRSGNFANLCPVSPLDDDTYPTWSYQGQVVARSLAQFDLEHFLASFEPDVVFHLASITDTTVMDQAQMVRDNVEPFELLLNYAIESERPLVWASSAATYGTSANGATPEKRPFEIQDAGHPANVYGFSKHIMENMHRQVMQQQPDLPIVGLRYFNVFGPGESHKGKMASMTYQLALQMLDGKRPRIFHDGEQARDQVYVTDVAKCTLAAALPDAKPGIYNVGSGEATSFNQIIAHLNTALGTDLEPEYFDNPYDFYQDYTCADISQTTAGLNWSPEFSAAEGISRYAKLLQAMG